MKFCKCLLILICSAFSFRAAAEPDSILFKGFAKQYLFSEQLLNTCRYDEPLDGQLKAVKDLENRARNKGDRKLELLMKELAYRMSLRHSEGNKAEAEKGLLDLLKQLDESNVMLKADVMDELSNYYWSLKVYVKTFEYDLLSYKLYSTISLAEFPQKKRCLSNIGGHYYYFRDFENAKRYFYQLYKEGAETSPTNTLALCYQQLNRLDSAIYYYKKAAEIASHDTRPVWTGIISGNLAHLYFLQKNYSQAGVLLERCRDICLAEKLELNAIHAMSELALVYLYTGEELKALETAKQAYTLLQKNRHDGFMDLVRGTYPRLAEVFAEFGHYDLAYSMLDSASIAKDTASRRSNALVFAGVQHKLNAQERLQLEQKNEREKKFQLLVRNTLIVGLILLAVIAALLINRQRLKYKHQQSQLELEKQQTESELQNASNQLKEFMSNLSDKNDLIEKFAAEIKRMQLGHGTGETLNATLLELQKSTILSDEEWKKFQDSFDKVHQGFLKRLQQKVKGLSPVETRFMLLSRLRLSSKEMAAALGISTEAAKLNRARLRSKLSLPDEEFSLEEFAASI